MSMQPTKLCTTYQTSQLELLRKFNECNGLVKQDMNSKSSVQKECYRMALNSTNYLARHLKSPYAAANHSKMHGDANYTIDVSF